MRYMDQFKLPKINWKSIEIRLKIKELQENGYGMERKLPIERVQDNPIYAGLVETMDDAVGVVLIRLKSLNMDDNTIVVFTSDNGGVASGDPFSTQTCP